MIFLMPQSVFRSPSCLLAAIPHVVVVNIAEFKSFDNLLRRRWATLIPKRVSESEYLCILLFLRTVGRTTKLNDACHTKIEVGFTLLS